MPKQIIYKITYPNGKIYVGQDRTNCINYFGSADADLIAADFRDDQRQSFTVTREILWSSETASRSEVCAKEVEFILELESNNSAIGYNRWPKRSSPAAPPADTPSAQLAGDARGSSSGTDGNSASADG